MGEGPARRVGRAHSGQPAGGWMSGRSEVCRAVGGGWGSGGVKQSGSPRWIRRDDGRIRSDHGGDDEVEAVGVGACERGSWRGGGGELAGGVWPDRQGGAIGAEGQVGD